MTTPDRNAEKQAAAEAAVAEIRDGMLVGLGTGSTVAFAIGALGRRCREGLTVTTVATSLRTEQAARAEGITVLDFAEVSAIDLAIDGVDAIDPMLRAIKGAGGAMLREKIVAQSATRMIAICDGGKPAADLSGVVLPVEVLPFAQTFVAARIVAFGGQPRLRTRAEGGVYLTDQGNVVFDVTPPPDITAFALALQGVPGMMGHGYFPVEIDALYIGRGALVEKSERPQPGIGDHRPPISR
jgi:ribose 5-phosphate isomerase A